MNKQSKGSHQPIIAPPKQKDDEFLAQSQQTETSVYE